MSKTVKTKDQTGNAIELILIGFTGEIDNYHVYDARDKKGNNWTYKEALLNGDNDVAFPDEADSAILDDAKREMFGDDADLLDDDVGAK